MDGTARWNCRDAIFTCTQTVWPTDSMFLVHMFVCLASDSFILESSRGRSKGGATGPCPPNHGWKNKTQLPRIHVGTAATINDHKTAHKHSSLAPFQTYDSTKSVQLQGGFAPWPPDQGLCPWTPLGAQLPDPHYRLALLAHHMASSKLYSWIRPCDQLRGLPSRLLRSSQKPHVQLVCFVEFARWRHRGQSLPSPTASCSTWSTGIENVYALLSVDLTAKRRISADRTYWNRQRLCMAHMRQPSVGGNATFTLRSWPFYATPTCWIMHETSSSGELSKIQHAWIAMCIWNII